MQGGRGGSGGRKSCREIKGEKKKSGEGEGGGGGETAQKLNEQASPEK